jgi:hypothetical protein
MPFRILHPTIALPRQAMRFDMADLCWRDTPSPDEVLVDQQHMLVTRSRLQLLNDRSSKSWPSAKDGTCKRSRKNNWRLMLGFAKDYCLPSPKDFVEPVATFAAERKQTTAHYLGLAKSAVVHDSMTIGVNATSPCAFFFVAARAWRSPRTGYSSNNLCYLWARSSPMIDTS